MLKPPAPAIADNWHVFSATEDVPADRIAATRLFDEALEYTRADGSIRAWRRSAPHSPLPVLERYGFCWTSLGTPPAEPFAIAEYAEPDRFNICAGSIGVGVSAPRAIENFLDMGHFPYVHTGILGDEPHTEVKEYDVEVSDARDEILATRCRFFQPMAALSAGGGMEVEYVYRVPHPYCAVLYKSCPTDPDRMDVIAIFCQPTSEETIRAHLLLSMIDEVNTLAGMRRFQQTISGRTSRSSRTSIPRSSPSTRGPKPRSAPTSRPSPIAAGSATRASITA